MTEEEKANIGPKWQCLEKYAETGLRTLVVCKMVIRPDVYKEWAIRYGEASTSI